MAYNGYSIDCGCTCIHCHGRVLLEGYSDADGSHNCPRCGNYVRTREKFCEERTPEKVEAREERIKQAGAGED